MTSRRFRWLPGCLVLACALLPSKARAAVVWTATFETGDSSEWMPGTNPTKGARKNFEVLGEQVYRGKFAGKITVHPDDTFGKYNQDRVDIQHQSTLTGEGKEMWISGHYLMPEDSTTRNEIAFFESNTSFQNVMDVWVDAKAGGGTTISFGTDFLGKNVKWTADFTKGVWHQLALHVLWSTDKQKGYTDVWFDGQQVVTAAKNSDTGTKADGNTLFFQTGLHRKLPTAKDDTIYFDDFIEADSMADAGIAAPTSDPASGGGGSGGASAAGGAAGAGGGSNGGVGGGGSPLGGTGGAVPSTAGAGGTPTSAGSTSIAGASTAAGTANSGGSTTTSAPAAANDSSGCSLGGVDPSNASVSALLGLLGLAALRSARRRR